MVSNVIRLQREDFDIGIEWASLRALLGGRAGAMAAFCGVVRDQFDDAAIRALALEHYPGMTERSMEKIVEQAAARWPLDDVVVIHRVGTLNAAAQIVFVQVGSRHRDAAFAGASFIMDYLKTDAVFWKREERANSSNWIQSTSDDRKRRGDWDK